MSFFKYLPENGAEKENTVIYFTCHADDFSSVFSTVSKSILSNENVTVCCSEDMSDSVSEKEISSVLDTASLVVVPISLALLKDENRAMKIDVRLAKEKNIPLLPIMAENNSDAIKGVEMLYSSPGNFGKRKALNLYSDVLPDSFDEKLSSILKLFTVAPSKREELTSALGEISDSNYVDARHNYLGGLAYLTGTGVETDCKKGIAMIEKAAEALYSDAMKMLYRLTETGLFEELEAGQSNQLRLANKILASDKTEYKRCRKVGKKDEKTLYCLGELARDYFYISNYKKSIKLFKEALELKAEVFGKENEETYEAAKELAVRLLILGAEDEALVYLKETYEIASALFGKTDYRSITALNTIIAFCDSESALSYCKEYYELKKELYGEGDRGTVEALSLLGNANQSVGNFSDAYGAYSKIIEIDSTFEHPFINGDGFMRLAENLLSSGEYEKAFELVRYEYLSVYGKNSDEKSCTENQLAVFLKRLSNQFEHSDNGDKLKYYIKSYELISSAAGKESRYCISLLSKIAKKYYALGEYESAVEYAERAYNDAAQYLDKNVEADFIIDTQQTLGESCIATKDSERALEIYNSIYERNCSMFGEESENAIYSLSRIGLIYYENGDSEKAKEYISKAYDSAVSSEGITKELIISLTDSLARLCISTGDDEKSDELLDSELELLLEYLRENEAPTLSFDYLLMSYNSSAATEEFSARIDEYISNVKKIIFIFRRQHNQYKMSEYYDLLYAYLCSLYGAESEIAKNVMSDYISDCESEGLEEKASELKQKTI